MKYLLLALLFFCSVSQIKAQEPAKTAAFVSQFTKGKAKNSRNYFSNDLKKSISLTQMKNLWTMVQKQFGDFEKVTYLRTNQVENNSVSEYDILFKNSKFILEVSENNEKKISGFYLKPLGYKLPAYGTNTRFGKENVKIISGEYILPGEIILPLGVDKPPLLILVHGSGPNDRDESIGPSKVFYDLALGLAANGIATLRYDKRTKIYDSIYKNRQYTLWEETIEDAIHAVNLAKTSTLIDTSNIFVLGHSLGAMAAPYISNHSNAAGVIMLAGPYRSLSDIIPEQMAYMSSLDGKLSRKEKKMIQKFNKRRDMIQKGDFNDSASNEELMGYWPGMFWKTEKDYLPAQHIKEGTKPLLILQGSRDYQVSPTKDFEPLRALCETRMRCQAILYDGLNHLFIKGTGTPGPTEYFTPGNVEETVINDIAAWIKHQPK